MNMGKHILFLLFCMVLQENSYSQRLSQGKFDSLLDKKPALYFDDVNMRYYGCGMNLDCMSLPVLFSSIDFDKRKNQLTVSGFVNPMSTESGDTLGANWFKLFVARPENGKLTNIRVLADVLDTVRRIMPGTSVDLKRYEFSTTFNFTEKDCLYFESGFLYKLKEYRIGELLSKKNK